MCKQCEIKPVYVFTNKRKLCKLCFINYFQKKVLYTIRKFKMIQSEDVVVYKLGKDFRNVVLRDILQMFAEKAPIELIKLPTKKKIDKIAVSSTIDSEANEIVQYIIKKNIKKLDAKPVDNKIVKPLYLFLDEEVLIYAKIKKLKFTPTKIKKDNISEFIDVLEMKHPEIKRAIVNSYLKI